MKVIIKMVKEEQIPPTLLYVREKQEQCIYMQVNKNGAGEMTRAAKISLRKYS